MTGWDPSPELTERFTAALAYAAELHSEQKRKGGDIPYIGHLLSVAGLVIEAGGSETEVIGALLHDAAEDQGGEATLAVIEERFGADVAQIVRECSDTLTTPKPPWRHRKEAYLSHLLDALPQSQLVSLADKLDNARAILRDFRREGPKLWGRFQVADPEQHLWYYRSLLEVFQNRLGLSEWLIDEFRRVVEELEETVRAAPAGGSAEREPPLAELAHRGRHVADALTKSQAWLSALEEELKAESLFLRPGDPEHDIDYDFHMVANDVFAHTRATIKALEAEREAIADCHRRWAQRYRGGSASS